MSQDNTNKAKIVDALPKTTKAFPILLSVVLYSIASISVICILALSIAVSSHLTQFKALYTFFNSATFASQIEWYIYVPILFFALSLYSSIQLMRRQKHALYLFAALSLSLSIFIITQKPIDYTNLGLSIALSLIVLLHAPWLFKNMPSKAEDQ